MSTLYLKMNKDDRKRHKKTRLFNGMGGFSLPYGGGGPKGIRTLDLSDANRTLWRMKWLHNS